MENKNDFYKKQEKLLRVIANQLTDFIDWDGLALHLEKELNDPEFRLLWNATRKYKTPVIPMWSKQNKKKI